MYMSSKKKVEKKVKSVPQGTRENGKTGKTEKEKGEERRKVGKHDHACEIIYNTIRRRTNVSEHTDLHIRRQVGK